MVGILSFLLSSKRKGWQVFVNEVLGKYLLLYGSTLHPLFIVDWESDTNSSIRKKDSALENLLFSIVDHCSLLLGVHNQLCLSLSLTKLLPQSLNWSKTLDDLLRFENVTIMITKPCVSSSSIPNLVGLRISLFKKSKTSWGMRRSKQTIQGCTVLTGQRRWITAVFARTMPRWSIGHISRIL